MNCSPPSSSVYDISQTRILEWVTIFFSKGSSQPRDRTLISHTGKWILYQQATREAHSSQEVLKDITLSPQFQKILLWCLWHWQCLALWHWHELCPASLAIDAAAAAAKSLQSCLTLWDPIDGSPPGSPIPGILQARTLEWVAISFSNAWKWKVKVESLSRVQL